MQIVNILKPHQTQLKKNSNYLPNNKSTKSGLNKLFANAAIAGLLNEMLTVKAGNKIVVDFIRLPEKLYKLPKFYRQAEKKLSILQPNK
ncbi:MAG: hypothetical protein WBA93_27085 [Microcoleaceae cyanobacterium]